MTLEINGQGLGFAAFTFLLENGLLCKMSFGGDLHSFHFIVMVMKRLLLFLDIILQQQSFMGFPFKSTSVPYLRSVVV